MRPIPPLSTDLLYSGPFERADLEELGHALGVSDLKFITTATLKPEHVLYHACLNGIQTYVKILPTDEMERAKAIGEMADKLYDALLPEFQKELQKNQTQIDTVCGQAESFCQHMHDVESAEGWNPVRFDNRWSVHDYLWRWQRKAIENYRLISERIAHGDFTPSEGKDAGSLTAYWSERNLEYKNYRDLARRLVEPYIEANIPAERLLTMHPTQERTTTMFLGGMASGKSSLTDHYLELMPPQEREDRVFHNADYLKLALYLRAQKDGLIPEDHVYTGAEVQAASSNGLYEGARKRGFLARQHFHAPDVVLNSIGLGELEAKEGLAGGGKVIAHHVHISPDDAVAESNERCTTARRPSENDIRWSAKASAQSLMQVIEPNFRKMDFTLHLYDRACGKEPCYYATVDVKHARLYIHDASRLEALAQTAGMSLKEMVGRFLDSGFSITLVKDKECREIAASFDAQAWILDIRDSAAFNANMLAPMLKQAASRIEMGAFTLPTPNFKEVLHARS